MEDLDDDSTDVFKSNIVERYSIRPDSIPAIDKLCLAEFAAYYYKDYRKDSDETSDAQPEVLTNEVIQTQHSNSQDISLPLTIKLMNTKEKMKCRKVKAVIRYHTPNKTKEPERYFHHLLMLYYPWRNESELMAADQSYTSKFYEPNVQDVVESNRSVFEPDADAVTEALENLRNDQGNIIYSFDPISDQENSDLQIETQNLHDTLPEESFNEQLPSDLHVGSSSDSSPQVSQAISTYTQPTEISDDMLRNNVRSLNEKQRFAYNIALSWCRNTMKNLNCLKPEKVDPINLFVTGGAGAGKSHLIKAIYHTAVKTFRYGTVNPDRPTVALMAPTGVAAININGTTIHTALSVPKESGDFASPMSDQKRTQLRLTLSELKIIIVDEISMVANTTLLHIHQRLKEIFNTPNSELFARISFIAVGDLYQLPPIRRRAVFENYKNDTVCAKMAAGLFHVCCKFCWILLFCALTVSRLFNVCVDNDFVHHSALVSRAVPFSRSDFGSFAYFNFHHRFKRVIARSDCHISKPIIRSSKRGFTSLALPGKFFWMDLTVYMDVQQNPGPPFDEFGSGYASLVTTNLNSRSACSGRISYSRWELLRLKTKYYLSPNVYSTLKCLRILKIRRSRGGRRVTLNLKYISTVISSRNGSQHHRIHRFANHNNLLSLPRQLPQGKLSQFVCSLINARSIRNKTLLIQDFVLDNLVDVLMITETWLSRCGDEVIIGEICPPGYRFFNQPRLSGNGGGVGLLYKANLHVKTRLSHDYRSFEYLDSTIVSTRTVRVISVYRPPPSAVNGLTVDIFLDEFGTLIEELVVTDAELLIVGDFNFRMDDLIDGNAIRFSRLLETFDLQQHVKDPTHLYGHILDLVITRSAAVPLVSNFCVAEQPISDHKAITFNLTLNKPPNIRKTVVSRTLKNLDVETFIDAVNQRGLPDDNLCLASVVSTYEQVLEDTLNQMAPFRSRLITIRNNAPWYSDEIAIEKRL